MDNSLVLLSNDLNVITAEINSYKQIAGQSIFEIGRRLKYVREQIFKEVGHNSGQWSAWLKSVDFDITTAKRFIRVFEEFGTDSDTWHHLTMRVLYEISTMSPEERSIPHAIPSSGQEKMVDEMTVRELREVKKTLKDKEKEVKDLQDNNQTLHDTIESLKALPPETKQVVKEVVPERIKNELEDLRSKYDKTKSNEEALQKLIGEIDSEKSRLEEYISSSEFELLETKRKEEIMQSKTHVSMFDLQLKIQKFINEAAPPLYLQGAMAYADSYVRRELIESTKSLEKYVENLKEYLSESSPKNRNHSNIIEINQIEESINE